MLNLGVVNGFSTGAVLCFTLGDLWECGGGSQVCGFD